MITLRDRQMSSGKVKDTEELRMQHHRLTVWPRALYCSTGSCHTYRHRADVKKTGRNDYVRRCKGSAITSYGEYAKSRFTVPCAT